MLKTERLQLRRLESSDVSKKYLHWLNDPQINQYLETRFVQHTYDSCLAFVEACNKSETEFLFGAFMADTGQHIGNIKIGLINLHHKVGDVSFFIGDKEMWGKGVASEMIQEILSYSFGTLKLQKVCAGCYESNFGSLKTLLKCGFTVEGFQKEQVMLGNRREGAFKLGLAAIDYK